MDANGLKFWMLASASDWRFEGVPPPAYEHARRVVTLGSQRSRPFVETTDLELVKARLAQVPQSIDRHDTFACFDATRREVLAGGATLGVVPLHALTVGQQLTDLAVGHDGVLYLAVDGQVILRDLRDRWDPVTLALPDLQVFRIAADPDGGAWVLDRAQRRLGRVEGLPFPRGALREAGPTTFRPHAENPSPPRLRWLTDVAFAADEDPVAIATSPAGPPVVLCWRAGTEACVRSLSGGRQLGVPRTLLDARHPYSLGFVDAGRLVVLVANETVATAVAYGFTTETNLPDDLFALGELYPLAGHDAGPFAHALDAPARYPVRPAAGELRGPRRLVALSAPAYARHGVAANAQPIDSHQHGFVWHRIYLEAALPAGTGLRLRLAATDDLRPPQLADYHEHVFGEVADAAARPRGAWVPFPSELPFAPGLLPCPPQRDRAGLFTVMIQRTGRQVSALDGRYLWVRLELTGDGRSTPEVAALRAHGGRFSYVESYLPSVYHERLTPPESDAAAEGQPPRSSPADFLERFLGNIEGVLTVVEDRIANAHLLTDPDAAPPEALEWLGQWVGVVFDAAYPPQYRRRALRSAMELHRRRGTLGGLALALDIVTGDAVDRGELVIVEEFRLRRTFATILGADLADENDPLLAGLVDSGNSIVGDSLILGDELKREFTAVFRESLPERPVDMSYEAWLLYVYERFIDPVVTDRFFDRLAHKLTVLVHKDTEPDRLALIERVLQLEAPAHLEARVQRATHPLIVGVATLIGVDTFLRKRPPAPPVRLDQERLGARGFLLRPPSLDPRLEGGGA